MLEYVAVRFPSMSEATKAVAAIQSLVDCSLGAAFRSGRLEARIYGSRIEWEPVLYMSPGARAAARLAGLRLPNFDGPVAVDPRHDVSLITIPRPPVAEAAELLGPAPTEAHDRALRVMIVEDHDDTARMLAGLVEAWGWRAAIAPTGRQARDLASRFRPRVVLLDLGLPDEHGYRVAQDLRRDPGNGDINFVVVTGWAQRPDDALNTGAGIAHHLLKPVDPASLRSILDGYRSAA